LYLEIFLKNFFFKFQVPSTVFRVHSKRLNESNQPRVNSRTDPGLHSSQERALSHTDSSMRYRSAGLFGKSPDGHSLPTHEVFVRRRAGESNRKSRCFFQRTSALRLCEQSQSLVVSSLGTRIYTLDFKCGNAQVTTRAHTHTPSTRYRGPVFCSRLPWLRETRQRQLKTGHLFKK
jgi:hypothetical protein